MDIDKVLEQLAIKQYKSTKIVIDVLKALDEESSYYITEVARLTHNNWIPVKNAVKFLDDLGCVKYLKKIKTASGRLKKTDNKLWFALTETGAELRKFILKNNLLEK